MSTKMRHITYNNNHYNVYDGDAQNNIRIETFCFCLVDAGERATEMIPNIIETAIRTATPVFENTGIKSNRKRLLSLR